MTKILNDYEKEKDRDRLQRLSQALSSAREPANFATPLDLNDMKSIEADVRLREFHMGQIVETHRRISQLKDHLKLQLQLAHNYSSTFEYANLPDLLGRDDEREQEYLTNLRLATEQVRTAAEALKIARECHVHNLVNPNYTPLFVLHVLNSSLSAGRWRRRRGS